MIRVFLLAAAALLLCAAGPATPAPTPHVADAIAAARAHMASHEEAVVNELRALLALPNYAPNAPDIRANADALVTLLQRHGATARVLETPGANPAVYGELETPGATHTLMFYAHYDGQPIGTPSDWATPPYEPTLRIGRLEDRAPITPWSAARYPLSDDARIYARSSADDKSPVIAMLAAIDALREAHVPLSANLKFFLEGEEEAGSPHLREVLAAHRDVLGSDLWIFGDGPVDPRGLPRLVLGVRGVMAFSLTVYGPALSLHSGHYGNVAPNPGVRLARLIASMRADNGAITIAGFDRAADPISPQMRALARDAFDDAGMLEGPMLSATESGLSVGESVLRPSLNLTQLSYGGTGPARNAIDPEAGAHFDVRLTPGLAMDEVRGLIAAHIRRQGYFLVDAPPTRAERLAHPRIARLAWEDNGYPAAVAPLNDPGVMRVMEVARAASDNRVRIVPLLGGSLPIAAIGDVLHTPFVTVPIVNADDNQHAPNENLRMREFRQGVETYAALLAEGGNWR